MVNFRKLILENEAVLGIKSPADYQYVKIIRFTLAFVVSWPRREIGEDESESLSRFLQYSYLISIFVFSTGSVFYLVLHIKTLNFFEIGHSYIILLIQVVQLSRVSTLTLSAEYRRLATDFLTKIHLFFYKDKSVFSMKTHKQIHLISHVFTLFLTFQMIAGLVLFNFIPMYSNYAAGKYKPGGLKNSTFEHSLYFSYPFNVSTSAIGYTIVCIVHWILSYISSIWFCMFDLFLSIMVFHIWGHFKILINKLNDFPKPTSKSDIILENITLEVYSKEELLQVSHKLKECIDYHREIIQFTDRMSEVFGPTLFVYYMFHQASGCLLLLECSAMTAQALMRYLPLTIILFQQLIQLSIVFELVGSESEKIKDAVYDLPWEYMDTKNRKVVHFFLMNVQEAVHVKALGLANVGVTSMATILKTSVTYFTFLNSM